MILRLIDWYLKRRGEIRLSKRSFLLEVTHEVQQLAHAAVPLIKKMDEKPFRGEYKRRQVYATLAHAYPDASRADVSLAVEVAFRRWKGIL